MAEKEKKKKRTNNDPHNTTLKSNYNVTRATLKQWVVFTCKSMIMSFIDGGDGGAARMLPNQQQMKHQSYK